jgi:hypothetical protein
VKFSGFLNCSEALLFLLLACGALARRPAPI